MNAILKKLMANQKSLCMIQWRQNQGWLDKNIGIMPDISRFQCQ